MAVILCVPWSSIEWMITSTHQNTNCQYKTLNGILKKLSVYLDRSSSDDGREDLERRNSPRWFKVMTKIVSQSHERFNDKRFYYIQKKMRDVVVKTLRHKRRAKDKLFKRRSRPGKSSQFEGFVLLLYSMRRHHVPN